MNGKDRVFTPEVEKVWHKDYQCEYYRGVIIDGEDHIVERCAKTHANYDVALRDAEKKMAGSPLYSRQTSSDIKEKLEEYKKRKAIEEKRNAVVIFDPEEWNEWQYIYEPGNGGSLYRFRYMNQATGAATYLTNKGKTVLAPFIADKLSRQGESDRIFYSDRIRSEYDIEKLPGHKDIWKILSIVSISENENQDSEVTVRYVEFNNFTKDFGKREKTKTIVIKRKWLCYNELMEYIKFIK